MERATAASPRSSSQPQYGGVVYAKDSGAVSIIDSDVTGCSAQWVRRVEPAAALQRFSAARDNEGLAYLTPLSPRNRSPAASSIIRWEAVRSR